MNRRDLLKLPLAAPLLGSAVAANAPIDEFDPANIKISHRVSIRVSDDDLLFLKQIGLRYFRAEIPLDASRVSVSPCITAPIMLTSHPISSSVCPDPSAIGISTLAVR
jgi:hypothetical protein